MKKIKELTERILISLITIMTILLLNFFITNTSINAMINNDENDDELIQNNLFHGYNIENVSSFLEYLVDLGVDVEDDDL